MILISKWSELIQIRLDLIKKLEFAFCIFVTFFMGQIYLQFCLKFFSQLFNIYRH